MSKLVKRTAEFEASLSQKSNGQFKISVPVRDARSFLRKLPPSAHVPSLRKGSKKMFVPVRVTMEWEGMVRE